MAEVAPEPRREDLTCLDLFCGCGGFSLGMRRAGYRALAAIDFNEEAINTFKANFPKETLALHKDLTQFSPAKLAAKLGVNQWMLSSVGRRARASAQCARWIPRITAHAFWRRKLSSNQKRDQVVYFTLRRAGWRVIRIWECALAKHPEICVRRIQRVLTRD